MKKKYNITGGLYLVLDPSINQAELLQKTQQALEGGVQVLQLWNNWPADYSLAAKKDLIARVVALADAHQVPVLINQEWQLLKETGLAGVHFDSIPADLAAIRAAVGRSFICGITCTNNLEVINWAAQHQADYVSFCSMFPSASAGACEIVQPDTLRRAREITQLPFFLSGGITPDNIGTLQELDFNGIAVISGILNAPSVSASAAAYQQALTKYTS